MGSMKPEEIKAMSRNIMSDGKIKEPKPENDGMDDMKGVPESMHIEYAHDGGGGMATTHFAAQPYQEGNTEDLPTPPQHHKRAFKSHDELAEHVRRVGKMGGMNRVPAE